MTLSNEVDVLAGRPYTRFVTMADPSDIVLTVHDGEVLLSIPGVNGGVEIFLTPTQALKLIEGLSDGVRQILEGQ